MDACITLTEEQRKRIEENKRKALEKRAAKLQPAALCKTGNIFHAIPTSILNQQLQTYLPLVSGPVISVKSNNHPNKEKCYSSSSSQESSDNAVQAYSNIKASLSNEIQPFIGNSIKGNCTLISRERFCVEVVYNSQLIEIFRAIPSRIYDAKDKKWNFAIKDHKLLLSAVKPLAPGVTISPLPKHVLNVFSKTNTEVPQIDLSNLDYNLKSALMPFQTDGVRFGIKLGGRVLIADDMGLGKTIQAIAIAQYYKDEWPLLVVAPSSVLYSWSDAFTTWLPALNFNNVTILNTGKDIMSDSVIVVILSYNLLTKRAKEMQQKKFKVVIMDESHFLKNKQSARTSAAVPIMKKCKRLILLTGTPALSRPQELYVQVSAVNSKAFPSYHEFGIRYCEAKETRWGWDYSGSSNMTELQLLLEEAAMIRRLKSDVISQLPPKRREVVLLDPHSIHARQKYFNELSTQMCKKNLHAMERRGLLMQFFRETGISKLTAVCDYIKDLLEAGKKFICFAHHQSVLDGICSAIEKKSCGYIRIDGTTHAEIRKKCCDVFQFKDECRVAVLSITAANAGISLTSAHLVIFAELFWNPGILTQAEDRAHRIGQQDSVLIQYLVAKGTADDHIWPLVQQKLHTLNKVGLSKDNFSEVDLKKARDPFQPQIYEYLQNTSGDEEFWTEMLSGEVSEENSIASQDNCINRKVSSKKPPRDGPTAKKSKVQMLLTDSVYKMNPSNS